jgi:hypothetical protein
VIAEGGTSGWGQSNLSTLASGKIILSTYSVNITNTAFSLYTFTSLDDGNTWTQSAALPAISNASVTNGPILEHSSGTLLLPFYFNNGGANSTFYNGVLLSYDSGITWPQIFYIDGASANGFNETQLIELADHSIMAFCRNDNLGNNEYIFTSNNVGQTWTQSSTTIPFGIAGECAPVIIPHTQTIVVMYRQNANYYAYTYSTNNGVTWVAGTNLGSGFYEYAAGVALDNDTVGFAIANLISPAEINGKIDFVSLRVLPPGLSLGAWNSSFTPVIANGGTCTAVGCRYQQTGKTINFNLTYTLGTPTQNYYRATMPFMPVANTTCAAANFTANTGLTAQIFNNGGTPVVEVLAVAGAGTAAGSSGNVIVVSGVYESQ